MAVMTAGQVAALVQSVGWTSDSDIVRAVAISYDESKFDTSAMGTNRNGTHDWGLFQVNDVHKPTSAEKREPLPNARKAYQIYKLQGWKAWSTYNHGLSSAGMAQGAIGLKKIKANPDYAKDAVAGTSNIGGHSLNPLSGVSGAISGAMNALTDSLFKIGINIGAVVLAIVLIVLGGVLLARVPAGKVAKTAVKVVS